jgi:hypothetical protein
MASGMSRYASQRFRPRQEKHFQFGNLRPGSPNRLHLILVHLFAYWFVVLHSIFDNLGLFPSDSKYFQSNLMLNYRVADLDGLLEALGNEGVVIDPKREDYSYGRFAWITDPEGNRIVEKILLVVVRAAAKAPRFIRIKGKCRSSP